MDGFQVIATSIGVIGVVLLIVIFACRFIGPKTTAWICSNREEKTGFSSSKLYHANGYLIPSGSEFLLNPSGSFKRFESIDRDYKPIGQTSLSSSPVPPWDGDTHNIPPQPLRPAPPSPTLKENKFVFEHASSSSSPERQKQQNSLITSSSPTHGISTIIPRPITKRQHSSPAGYGVTHINLSEAAARIANGPRSCTNPFLNGSLSICEDTNSNSNANANSADTIPVIDVEPNDNNPLFTVIQERAPKTTTTTATSQNPFSRRINENSIFSFPACPTNGNVNDDIVVGDAVDNVEAVVVDSDSGNALAECALIQFDDINDVDMYESVMLQQQFRNRSMSDTQAFNSGICNATEDDVSRTQIGLDEQLGTNPFVGGNIHKTVSDTQLEKLTATTTHMRTASQTWSFGRSLNRQTTASICNTTKSSLLSSGGAGDVDSANDGPDLKRAMSCDSVNSESSVILSDLEQQIVMPTVTGMLCVGLQHDKSTMTDEGMELILTVMEAKELIGPPNADTFDTFVRIYMVPDESGAVQTKLFRNSTCPSFNETFSFWLNKQQRIKRSLWFHVYHSGNIHTLIGETEFQIGDVRRPITTWLSLSDSRHNNSIWGELMFSLSYLPTAERLTVVIVKARNLKHSEAQSTSLQNVCVKVYLLKNAKKVSKKKTSVRRSDSCPIFNESMIFSVPPNMLNAIQIRLTVVNAFNESTTAIDGGSSNAVMLPIGHVIVGSGMTGKGLRHWNQMLSSLRKPVAMWHAIRQSSTEKTGNSPNQLN